MLLCSECGKNPAAKAIGFCVNCLRNKPIDERFKNLHETVRRFYSLPLHPPKTPGGLPCKLCDNHCQLSDGQTGYCGLRQNRQGRIIGPGPRTALAYFYLDPLPTNCCAAWFCKGSTTKGYNLAVFLYGCNFDCLFCQNASHKQLKDAPILSEDQLVEAALDDHVRCVCFFGGSPEPQLGFVLKTAQRIIRESNNTKHICLEWNGCGNPKLVDKAAQLALKSGGTIKFDLKAYHLNVVYALCGVTNQQAFKNFARLSKKYAAPDFLTATTLLVPYYVDYIEVEAIARFISSCHPDIPYSLLVYHPDFYLKDLPITPKEQVMKCYEVAGKYLNSINIGNKHLLALAQ